MDIDKYISSGILEAYAMGDLSSAERADVERMISLYPEIRAELTLIEETLEAVAVHTAVAPNANLREKVLRKAIGAEGSGTANPVEENGKVVPFHEKQNKSGAGRYKYYLAAAITFAVLTSFAALFFYSRWQDAEDRLYVAVAERTAMAQNFKTVENQLDSVSRELAIYANENFNEIELQGLALAPEASATVFWNRNTSEVFLNPSSLPAAPADKQYQLWAIVDGEPVDLGVLSADRNRGLLKMKEVEGASAFAITLEPAGGSPAPTLDQMYVLGETS